MKELSIQEKAERYDKAIEIARYYYNDRAMPIGTNFKIEKMFPELKEESEDDKIRRALIKDIDVAMPIETAQKYIAWLEKQGEKKPAKNIVEIWKDMRLEVYQQASGNRHEPNYSDDTTKMFSLNDIDEIIEKMSEQRLVDKIEPKFKVEAKFHEGEWITNGDYTWKIVMVKFFCYVLQSQGGNVVEDTIPHVDEKFHSFTIKDAKDGDVLASELCYSIILFKGINDDNNIDFYCDYDFYETDVPGDRFAVNNGQHYGNVEDSKDFHPATKEQRDILMKAMADAGYAFDFKKLELKKIVVPIFNIGDTIVEKDLDECGYGTIKDIKDGQYIFTDGSSINIDEQGGWQLKTSTSIERKPTDWSEEDEKMLNQVISIIEDADDYLIRAENISIYTNWLKSLKPKYQWKPTIRQLTALEYAVNDNTLSCDELYTLNELYEQLKKL